MATVDVLIRTHHEPTDDYECCCDPCGVSVIVNGACVMQFGDDHHDDGQAKAKGYVYAIQGMGYACTLRDDSRPDAIDWEAPKMPMLSLADALRKAKE